MKSLPKLKKINIGIIYDIFSRALAGALLAFYLSVMVNTPLYEQIIFFILFAVVTVIFERIPKITFKSKSAKINEGILTLLGNNYTISEVEYIKYEQTNKYSHTMRIKLDGYQEQDLELNSPDFICDLRLFKFINKNFMPITMVDSLK